MTALEQPTKKPGPNLWLSIFIFIAGAVLASVGVIMLGGSLLGAITEDAFEIPGGEQRDLDAGSFDVFVSAGGTFDFVGEPAASAQDVTITNLDTGENLAVTPDSSLASVGRGTTVFVPIATFEVVEPGSYQIAVVSDVGGLALVSRALPNSFSEVQNQVIMMGAGFVLALIGAVMLVVGTIRRSRAKKQAASQPYPGQVVTPPGQFQQPPPTPPAAQQPQSQSPTPPPGPPPAQPPSSGPADSATPWDS